MDTEQLQSHTKKILKKWWASLLILPFAFCSTQQVLGAVNNNIFYATNYDYPLPFGIVHFFVDNFLLIVHEAGHTFFGLLGNRFITILGGSLFQILLPLAILAYCVINRKDIGLQFSFCLVAYSWMDVAIYALDGGARQLPLIGGLGKEAHDWHNLLIRMDALEHDITFAVIFFCIGVLCYGAALVMPQFHHEYQEANIDLKLG